MTVNPHLLLISFVATVLLTLVSLTLRLTATIEPTPVQNGAPESAALPADGEAVAVGVTPTTTTAANTAPAGGTSQTDASHLLAAAPAEPGQPISGGIFVEGLAQDADTLNPLLTTNETSLAVARLLWPALVGQDPQGGFVTPDALAREWEWSDDGRIYTFTLRSGITWSDGQPVTAQDVQFTFAALADESVQSPYRAGLAAIEQLRARDDQTVVVSLARADCAALHLLRHPLLPSHLYHTDFSDLRNSPLNEAPTVSAGPFRFAGWQPGEEIRLVRNPTYWQGAPHLEELRFRIVPDATLRIAQLLAGAIDATHIPPDQVGVVDRRDEIVLYQSPADSYSFLALNLADPQNPQPGQDGDGGQMPQAPHPILGDLRVRRALALALDYPQLLAAAYGDQYYRQATPFLPSLPWAYAATLSPYPRNLGEAADLLAAAGWIDNDGDGVRERDGVRLVLTLLTNDDSPARVRMGELVAQQLAQAGFEVQARALPFEELADVLFGQRFDLALAGWENIGPDPATGTFWHSRDDLPGSGLNLASFQDGEVDSWLDGAAGWPGCDPEMRGRLYRQVQERLYEQVVTIPLGGPLRTWAYRAGWGNVQPGPWGLYGDVHRWRFFVTP
jgi:peptide/nickel transport system substrate-binding protein